MRISEKRIVLVASTTPIVALGVTAARAYWTSSDTSTAGTTTLVTVLQTNAAITGLFPGGTAAGLSGVFGNSAVGAVPVKVGQVMVSSVTVDSGHSACAVGDLSTGNLVIAGTDSVSTHTLATGNSVGTWSGLTIQLAETGANQDVCKGATFTVNYAVSAAA